MDTTFHLYRLDQLAHLGLPNQLFIPALLQELHYHIPSVSNSFIWINEKRHISNIYDELHHNSVIENIIERETSQVSVNDCEQFIANLKEPSTTLNLINKFSHANELCSGVFEPLGYINSCFVPIFSNRDTSLLGIIIVHRTASDFDFNTQEKKLLRDVSSIISDVWLRPTRTDIKTTDGWNQGLIVVDDHCNIIEACAMGDKLLMLASSPQFNSSWNNDSSNISIFDGITELIQNLSREYAPKLSLIDPTLEVSNAWGQFKVKAYLIKNKQDEQHTRICLNIYWQEPLVLKLFHKIKKLGLTPRQETVGLLYATGDPLQIIADKLGLSIFTVKEHIKNISTRIEMNSRAELIELLLCDV